MSKRNLSNNWFRRAVVATMTITMAATACGTSDGADSSESSQTEAFVEPPVDRSPLGGSRPAPVTLPNSYTAAEQWPLVIFLHGYSGTGMMIDLWWGAANAAETHGFIMVLPEGNVDQHGYQFWNGTAYCCDDGRNVDDVGYIASLIEEAKSRYAVNEQKVYLFSHSNGGFLSYRIACERPELITGLMSLAGSTFMSEEVCNPSEAVTILQVHGTQDQTISYTGHAPYYPGAEETVERWSRLNGCSSRKSTQESFDLDSGLAGDETTVTSWTDCTDGAEVELWTINNGAHIPGIFGGSFTQRVLDFLFAHEH